MRFICMIGMIVFMPIYSSEHTQKIFFIVGPCGSGKTTIADALKNKNEQQFAHYSVGNLLRQEAQKDTQEGRLINDILVKAHIVPLDIGMKVLTNTLINAKKPIVLIDGFPPTTEYLIAFDEFIKTQSSITIGGIIELMVSESIAKTRVVSRGRTDDSVDNFKKRYQRYIQYRDQLNEQFKARYQLHCLCVDGLCIEECINKVENIINYSNR